MHGLTPSRALAVLCSIALLRCGDSAPSVDSAAPSDSSAADGSAIEPSIDGSVRDAVAALEDGSDRSDRTEPPRIAPPAIPPDMALYTAGRARFGARDVAAAIESAIAHGARDGGVVDNVIVYVHGRGCGDGGEPEKSLAGAMPALAQDYAAAPVMVFWPGSDDGCPLGFPEERARAAGPGLAAILGDLHRYQLARPERRAALRFTLLTHSMGSLVLEAATAIPGVEMLPASLFDSLLVNAAASAASGHGAWVSRVRFGAARYVTVNSRDSVLTAAGLGRGARLGRSITGAPLAAAVDYLDFSANGVNHAYYLVGGQSGAGMIAFYARAMNGLPVDLASAPGISAHEPRDGAIVHVFNGR